MDIFPRSGHKYVKKLRIFMAESKNVEKLLFSSSRKILLNMYTKNSIAMHDDPFYKMYWPNIIAINYEKMSSSSIEKSVREIFHMYLTNR